jgi:hypothetical protein
MDVNSPDQNARKRRDQESEILDDIYRRTGLRFRHLGSIDRNQLDVMRRILPIVREWANSGPEEIRGALYFSFLTPAALPYLDDILIWAQKERAPVAREVLTQVMRLAVTPKTGRRIWEVYKGLDPTDSEALLLSKLAGVDSVSGEVIERIVRFLKSVEKRTENGELVRTFAMGPLGAYSKVRHPVVKAWFKRYLGSPDPELRAMARCSDGVKPVVPAGCHVVKGKPNHSRLILSTEVDSHELIKFLRQIDEELGAEFLRGIPADAVVESLNGRDWLVCDATGSKRGAMQLWLRLDDATTIEAQIVEASEKRPN